MGKNLRNFLGIVGLGYVGLPLAKEFSKKKNVIAFDLNKKKIIDFKKKNNKKYFIQIMRKILKMHCYYCCSSNSN